MLRFARVLILTTVVLCSVLARAEVKHPVFPPTGTVELWQKAGEPWLSMSPADLYKAVPEDSGIFFCGCPKCANGDQQTAMTWEPALGDTVKCHYCGTIFPNKDYPDDKQQEIVAPSGRKQVYRYYQDKAGETYYFQARAWFARWQWCQSMATRFANLYALTKNADYGDRAAAIVGRFAQVFPDYAVRYDYPYKPKRFWPGDRKWPYDPDIQPYRGAKFYWWGYGDIPASLALAYDLVAEGDCFERQRELLGPDIRTRIERDLIRLGYEFTAANPETYSNMSPGVYHGMVVAGRVIGAPEMVHEGVTRFSELVRRNFFFDGWWSEGTPSYHAQTIGHLKEVVEVAQGYSDPGDWPGERFENLDLVKRSPVLAQAFEVNAAARFPNGMVLPINDAWWSDKRTPTESAASLLWPGLGHAALGAGAGQNQFQVHLNWSGGFGHQHADNGSIMLYAFGEEMLSDLGYTHNRYRPWTLQSASHNLVVVDERPQPLGSKDANTTGNPLLYAVDDEHVRVVSVDLRPAYPGLDVYRRRLVAVHVADAQDYVVEVFDVSGGKIHDFFLHGSANQQGTFESSVSLDTPVPTLVPSWAAFSEPANESDYDANGKRSHAYGFLWNVKSGTPTGQWTVAWRYGDTGLRSHLATLPGDQAFSFVDPSVRQAGFDDAKLRDYVRHGLMLRRCGGTSRFVVVHEPFRDKPWLDSVTASADGVEVRHGDVTEKIQCTADRVTVESTVTGQYRVSVSEPVELASVRQKEAGFELVTKQPLSAKARYVRVEFGKARSFILPVTKIEGTSVALENDPGFAYDADTMRSVYHSFPQEEFAGVPTVRAVLGGRS